jgi:hypothetical protein
MNKLIDSGDQSEPCDCVPRCIDIATGVLMAREQVGRTEAHAVLLRAAERQATSLHTVSRAVIDSTLAGRSHRPPGQRRQHR